MRAHTWECQHLFENSTCWHGIADVLRYEILYRFGGVFIDADSECLRPLDESFLQNQAFCCYDSESARPGLLANGFLGASQSNELMRALIDELRSRTRIDEPAWRWVGPQFLTDTVQRLNYPMNVYPSYYFLPTHHEAPPYQGDFQPFCKHHWGTTYDLYGRASI